MSLKERELAPDPNRWLAIWEIASVTSSGLIALWTIEVFARYQQWIGLLPILLAIGLMIFSQRLRGETPRVLGFRFDNFWQASRLVLLPTVVAIVVIAGAVWLLQGQLAVRDFRVRLLFLPAWTLLQQYALQGFVNRRAILLFGTGLKSTLVVGLVFGILHLPSLPLAVLAFLGAMIWGRIYQQQPNLFALTLSHAAVSLVLSLILPASLTPFLRLGYKYFG